MEKSPFENLFVLELANNHWGRLDRGLNIIAQFAEVVRRNDVHAAIKLQFRDVSSFIHGEHRNRQDVRYIQKVGATALSWDEQKIMVDAVRAAGMVAMVTPFDELSVEKAEEFGVQILKIASSDISDLGLLEKIAQTGKPVIASSGGANLEDLDRLVSFFCSRRIPFALNHCVSIYPSKDDELELNQIDFLRARYPGLLIGFSTHEMTDWSSSVMMAYAKGARTFERHIDIDADGIAVSPYCTLPHQADRWFKAFNKAVEMCGASGAVKRVPPEKEVKYLNELVRGVYVARDLPAGHVLTADDVFLAVPLLHDQVSVREFTGGEVLKAPIRKDEPIYLTDIKSAYSDDLRLRRLLETRGVARGGAEAPIERVRVGAA
jgi:N-acetylneuraminate synthase